MKPYQTIEIIECNEPLVAIPPEEFMLENPSAYIKCGADYRGKSPYYLRKEVVSKLLQAKAKLTAIKPHWQLKIFDAYRPIYIQQHMVDYTFSSICQERNLSIEKLDESTKQDIYREVYQIWAIPSDNPLTPPPHSTGAAIDLTLMTNSGEEINMGGEIDELSPRSHPDYYAHSSQKLEQEYHENRCLLAKIMTNVGFRRHPQEWWHFSYGDQFWAWLENQDNSSHQLIAKYGGA